jgi:hypothetical protein
MARPTTRARSTNQQFIKRAPADVLRVAKGRKATVVLPADVLGQPDIPVDFTLGDVVYVSLRTRDPSIAKV